MMETKRNGIHGAGALILLTFLVLPVVGTADSEALTDTFLNYDDKQGLLLLTTTGGLNYHFSVRTGEIEQESAEGKAPEDTVAGSAGSGAVEERVILSQPARVTAKLVKAEAPTGNMGGSYEFDIAVEKGNEKFTRKTYLIGLASSDQAFGVLRKGTRRQGQYLIVRTECGGGNAWRCNRDAVFALTGNSLRVLGDVLADDRTKPAGSYKKGHFWDIYDKFEMNDLTSHAGAPGFFIALKEKNGRLMADLSHTWLRNRMDFRQRMTEIEVILRGGRVKGDQARQLEERLIANMVLARYCERKAEAVKLEKLAKAHLKPDRFESLLNIVSHVKPAEYPILTEEE